MSLRLTRYEGDPAGWDELVRRRGCLYQRWDFAAALEASLRRPVVRVGVGDGSGLRAALALFVVRSPLFGRFAVSLPVSDHAGVVHEDEEALSVLAEGLPRLLGDLGVRWIELRHRADAAPPLGLPVSEHKVTLELELPPSADALWDGLKAKVRNLVRKGERADLVSRQAGRDEVDAFYRVYAHNLRDLGTPCYPRRLFDEILARFPEEARLHFACLQAGGPVVAVGLTLRDGVRQRIPFAASLTRYRRLSANMFLYWRMLVDAVATGCEVFDFGRSSRDSGTHRFKRQWGARERPLAWSYQLAAGEALPETRVDNPRFRLAVAAWQRLPVPVATWLGPRVVRHLP